MIAISALITATCSIIITLVVAFICYKESQSARNYSNFQIQDILHSDNKFRRLVRQYFNEGSSFSSIDHILLLQPFDFAGLIANMMETNPELVSIVLGSNKELMGHAERCCFPSTIEKLRHNVSTLSDQGLDIASLNVQFINLCNNALKKGDILIPLELYQRANEL